MMIRKIIEKIKEADGGYGDLGVIPSAPSDLGKDKEKMIVDGEFKGEDEKEKDKKEE
jgi:hypothetical protein